MQGQQVSHYRLTEKLGAGTYGEVWKGVHVHDDQLFVAVKLMHAALATDEAFLKALKAECRVHSRLHHPNIVGFRELALSDAHPPAMVLELVPGGSLEGRLAAGPQPVDAVVQVLEELLSGLGYAHGKGVVHRDIKPGNVLLDSDGAVRVVDFGIARAADSGQATRTGVVQGTMDYIPPEVFQGGKAGPTADVYAVGLVAWELLAGRRACPDGPLAAKLGWHLGVGLADVRTVRPDCPAWLAEVVAALGSKDASARPVDGSAALALLRERRVGVEASTVRVTPVLVTPVPVAPGTVELSTAEVAASLPPGSPSTDPGTVSLSAGTSLQPSAPVSAPPTDPITAPQTVAVPAGSLPPLESEVDRPEPVPSSRNGKVLGAVAAVLVLGMGGWFAMGELDRRAALEAAYQSAASAGSIADWQAFLSEYPEHPRKGEAEAALSQAIEAEATRTGIADWMSIPGGSFEMGSESGEKDEQPPHTVTVGSFDLMKTEVTMGQYRKCVDAGVCSLPKDKSDSKHCNWGYSGREDHPINCVNWKQAAAFATWAGGRLPTEAEWEYAARSGGKSEKYPWGNEEATCSFTVMRDGRDGCGKTRTWPVCSKPEGNSRHDVCDLAGNVWEWTQDAWHDTYRGAPTDGTAWEGQANSYRVTRGGGWAVSASYLRASNRNKSASHRPRDYLGFRLAR